MRKMLLGALVLCVAGSGCALQPSNQDEVSQDLELTLLLLRGQSLELESELVMLERRGVADPRIPYIWHDLKETKERIARIQAIIEKNSSFYPPNASGALGDCCV